MTGTCRHGMREREPGWVRGMWVRVQGVQAVRGKMPAAQPALLLT